MQKGKHEPLIYLCNLIINGGLVFLYIILIFSRGAHMKFSDDREQREFVEIATMLKMYKERGVPIPADIRNEIERNRNKSEVFYVLSEIIKE